MEESGERESNSGDPVPLVGDQMRDIILTGFVGRTRGGKVPLADRSELETTNRGQDAWKKPATST